MTADGDIVTTAAGVVADEEIDIVAATGDGTAAATAVEAGGTTAAESHMSIIITIVNIRLQLQKTTAD